MNASPAAPDLPAPLQDLLSFLISTQPEAFTPTILENPNQAKLQEIYLQVIEAILAILEKHSTGETAHHSQQAANLTVELARQLNVPENELANIRYGALLHDIGLLGIPEYILQKPGVLDNEEWAIMVQHPLHAYHLLARIPLLQPILDIPYCHHEHWDGSGYPHGLKGEQIPLAARIFSVIDIWNAMSAVRPYRRPIPATEILSYIRSLAGLQLDSRVVFVFLRMIAEK